MVTDKKSSSGQLPPKRETGVLTERVELNPPPHGRTENQAKNPAENRAEKQPLLPHERDQTTGPAGAALANEDERSRDVIGQAADDTEQGLKDTDRRGIPSDIVASDVPAPNTVSSDMPDGKGKGEKGGKGKKGGSPT